LNRTVWSNWELVVGIVFIGAGLATYNSFLLGFLLFFPGAFFGVIGIQEYSDKRKHVTQTKAEIKNIEAILADRKKFDR